MTKKDLANMIAQELDITDRFALRIAKVMIGCMSKALVDGEKLELRDFGVFKTKIRKARAGRNPKLNTVVAVTERRVVVFKAGKLLKEQVIKCHI